MTEGLHRPMSEMERALAERLAAKGHSRERIEFIVGAAQLLDDKYGAPQPVVKPQ